MAQLVARLVRIEKVRGSNPLSSTIFEQATVAAYWSRRAGVPTGSQFAAVTVAAPYIVLGSGESLR